MKIKLLSLVIIAAGAAAPIVQQQIAYGQDFLIGSPDDPVVTLEKSEERREIELEAEREQTREEVRRQNQLERQQQSSPATTPAATETTFTDDTGLVANLPPGWIANDYQNTGPQAEATEDQLGYTKVVTFCKSDDAVPRLGSEVPICDIGVTTDWVQVFRYKDFSNKPEIAATGTPLSSLTAEHVYLYHLEEQRRWSAARFPSSGSDPIIYEQFSQPLWVVKEGQGAAQAATLDAVMRMVNWQYSLFFFDPSTNTGYRVTAGGSEVGDWSTGDFVGRDQPNAVPDAVDVVLYSVRLDPAPASVSQPLLTYTPSTNPDHYDPGAIVLAPEPASEPQTLPFLQ